MAENKKSFILYCDLIHTVEHLTDEQAGNLFKHILRYVNDQNPQTENPITKISFEPIKQQLKRDLEKFIKVKIDKSDSGKLGNLKRWHLDLYEDVISKKKTLEESLVIAKNRSAINPVAKIAVNDNVNVTVNDTINFKSLVDFINKVGNRNFKSINNKAKDKYRARIKEGYTKEDIQKAIVNAYKEPYHIESKFKYLTPEFFSRADKLDLYSQDSNLPKLSKLVATVSLSVPKEKQRLLDKGYTLEEITKAAKQ